MDLQLKARYIKVKKEIIDDFFKRMNDRQREAVFAVGQF